MTDGCNPAAIHRSRHGDDRGTAAVIPRRERDALIRDLASAQHGIVTRADLLAAGLPAHAIDHRVRDGRLVALYRAVYRVPGPVAGPYEREMAAVLACGEDALLSHGSAAPLLRLRPPSPPERPGQRAPVEVSVARGFRAPGPDILVHRPVRLDPEDRTVTEGVPVTAVARTLLDLAARETRRAIEQMMAVAVREGLAGQEELAAVVARHPCAPGAALLRGLLADAAEPAFTRSAAEERFLALIREFGLPEPEVNVRVHGFEVDFYWRAARLVVEVDGFSFHRHRAAFERDRARDAHLQNAGLRVIRVTWTQLRDEPRTVLRFLIRALLAA